MLAIPGAAACSGGVEVNASGATTGGTGGAKDTSTTTTTTTGGTTSTGVSYGTGGAGAVTGISGGELGLLNFVIVGDTRPPNEDDTAGYPTAVITKIWQDVEAFSPRPAFAVTTGDYQYANPNNTQQAAQIGLYLTARAAFSNVTFPAMGNHECTGETDSNCGTGLTNGITLNYTTFMSKMLTPLGVTLPYYTVNVASTIGAWTAKFVFIAANAWSPAQATWLDAELAKPTTYTFVIRHESATANTAPGVTPSLAIIAKHPYTLALVGHTHTYSYTPQYHEVIVGNGGAPLSGDSDYGYVVAQERASDGAIVFSEHDYMTNAVADTFAVKADGTAAP
jgi:Calcineurin-like phosphoesterase